MRLWVITSPDDFASEYDDIEEMFRRGLTRLILDKRSKSGGWAGTDEYERWLLGLPMECRDRIWLSGTPGMAERLDVRGCICDARLLAGEVPESWKRVNCIARVSSVDEYLHLPGWVSGALVGPVLHFTRLDSRLSWKETCRPFYRWGDRGSERGLRGPDGVTQRRSGGAEP